MTGTPAPRERAYPDDRTAADLASVLPASAEVRDGHLVVGGVDLVELAREHGTALYVMDEDHIRHQLREYLHWTRFHWNDVDVIYAGKAFMSLAMCRLVVE
jgi:diaminopimelate decarboxylase